jgi:hypothetical protein
MSSLTTFFVQVMVFCNINCANLIEIKVKLAHTLISSMAHCQHLPQQIFTKGTNIPKISQDTIKVKTKVMMEILFA